jgi:type I restriction enzyme, S subunit
VSELPAGWAWTDLAQVCTSITDGDHQAPPQVPHGIPFLVIGNIRNRQLNFTDCRHVPAAYFESLKPIRRPQMGDVLYSLVGSYGISVLVKDDTPFCVQRHIGILRPSPEISSAFLALVLASRAVFDQATEYATGTAQLTVPLSGLRRIRIPIPPRQEQERIVTAIEDAFIRIDSGATGVELVRRRLRSMRAAVHEAAVHEDKWVARQSRRLSDEGSLAQWRTASVGDVAEVSGGIIKNPKRAPKSNPVPFLRVANVQRDGLDLGEVHQIEVFEGELDRLRLKPSDLLIVEGNGSPDQIGRSALWDGSIDPCVHQNHLIRVRAGDMILPEFLNIFWNSPCGQRMVQAVASSTSGLHTLSTGKVRAIRVPLPPISTQREIVTTVADQLSWVDRMESAMRPVIRRTQVLRSSILSAALAGQLTPQDPSDESASILLERIISTRDRSTGGRSTMPVRKVRTGFQKVTA